ncbi:acryloyl-CoA reductase [Microbacterium betulae]|uniref:Acryloyl-CoA reductase n=1 Tax=Microbacterium betulae TaxID=2981139 RepID=A0AA97I5Y7_9MICO|nr:acryloyl-CoA reductase [Microbacterium sp. AB]WOF22557.1 acryloyl-CoA reductase [Microbacterium sp. AB]
MNAATARAFRIDSDGSRVWGAVERIPVAAIGGGELLVRTTYSSVNYKDALAATGAGKVMRRFPLTGGIDAVGVVADSSDARYRPGDRVLVTGEGMNEDHDGGYADWFRIPADWAVPLPAGLTDWESMALGTAGITAALAIHRLEHNGLVPGTGPVAVSGASGGVGAVAVALLAARGYEVTAISGKADAADWLRSLGASDVIARPDTTLHARPLESGRWAGAIDSVGGDILSWLLRTTRRDGSVAAYGNVLGNALQTSVLPFILRGVSLLGINTGRFDHDLRVALWQRLATDLKPARLHEMARTIELDDLPGAFDAFLAGSVQGRIVVRIGGDAPYAQNQEHSA